MGNLLPADYWEKKKKADIQSDIFQRAQKFGLPQHQYSIAGLFSNLAKEVKDMGIGITALITRIPMSIYQYASGQKDWDDLEESAKNTFKVIVDSYKEYGEDPLDKIYREPLGAFLDATAILSLGSGLAVKGGTKLAGVASKTLAKEAGGIGGKLVGIGEAIAPGNLIRAPFKAWTEGKILPELELPFLGTPEKYVTGTAAKRLQQFRSAEEAQGAYDAFKAAEKTVPLMPDDVERAVREYITKGHKDEWLLENLKTHNLPVKDIENYFNIAKRGKEFQRTAVKPGYADIIGKERADVREWQALANERKIDLNLDEVAGKYFAIPKDKLKALGEFYDDAKSAFKISDKEVLNLDEEIYKLAKQSGFAGMDKKTMLQVMKDVTKPISNTRLVKEPGLLAKIKSLYPDRDPVALKSKYDKTVKPGDFITAPQQLAPASIKRSKGIVQGTPAGGESVVNLQTALKLGIAETRKAKYAKGLTEEVKGLKGVRPLGSIDDLREGERIWSPEGNLKFYEQELLDPKKVYQAMEEGGSALDDVLLNPQTMIGVAKTQPWAMTKEVADVFLPFASKTPDIMRYLDRLAGYWKRFVLGTPRWLGQGATSGAVMNTIDDVGIPAYSLLLYAHKKGLLNKFLPAEVLNSGFHHTEVAMTNLGIAGEKPLGKLLTALENTPLGKGFLYLSDKAFKWNEAVESMFRRANYTKKAMDYIKETGAKLGTQDEIIKQIASLSPEVQAKLTDQMFKTLGNYRNFSPLERNVIKKVYPFYSWYRHLAKFSASLPFDHPLKANLIDKLSEVAADENEDELRKIAGIGEKEPLPEWIKQYVHVGKNLKTGQDILVSGRAFNPLADLTDIGSLAGTSPLIKIPIERFTGTDIFTGKKFQQPGVVEFFGNQYRITPEGDVQTVKSVAPPLTEHVLRQIPQYAMIKEFLFPYKGMTGTGISPLGMTWKPEPVLKDGKIIPVNNMRKLFSVFGISFTENDLADKAMKDERTRKAVLKMVENQLAQLIEYKEGSKR